MALSLVAAPAIEPLTLLEAKAQCKVDSTDEDALIQTLIVAARGFVESFTHRALITQTWDLKLDAFPNWLAPITLPMPPVQSVTSISYIDMAGATQTWSPSLYETDLPAGPNAGYGRILPAYQQIYPVTRLVMNAVTVRFVAGYGALKDVPAEIKAAMKLLIGNWWFNREAGQIVRGSVEVLPFGVEALLWPFKAFACAA
jgi:uncharacterized phiE125 gp8 family phage protein